MAVEHKSNPSSQHVHWLEGHPEVVRKAADWTVKNWRPIAYAAGAVLLIVAVWGAGRFWQEQQQMRAASLYAALPMDEAERAAGLAALAEQYPTTGAGLLAQFRLGRNAFEAGEYAEAAKWFERLEKRSGQAMIQILAQHDLAAVHEARGEWEKALALYQKAAVDPANESAAITYYHLGRVLEAMQRRDEARTWYQKAVEKGLGLSVADRAKERMLWLDIES